LLGRDRELSLAERALREAAAGRSRTLLVGGAPGMGKTALVAAIVARAGELGFRIGSGTSAPVEGAWPYAPVVEALAEVCRRDPGLLGGLAGHHRDEIERVLTGAENSWTGDGSHQRLFVAVAELVRLASAPTGLLLTVDDVHDADDASLRLLHYLARSAYDRPVCIAVSHRPAPMTDALAQTRRSLLEQLGAVELTLGPLGASDVAALVRRHVEEPPASWSTASGYSVAASRSLCTSSPAGQQAGRTRRSRPA
jgi:Predicted ATPase